MSGKVLASYLVKITVHATTGQENGEDEPDVPTNDEVEELVENGFENDFNLKVKASSERTDQ